MAEFAKGVNCKTIKTKFGDIIKLGVHLEQFGENPINESGFINIEVKKAKSGEFYVVLAEQAPSKE